VFPFYRSWFTVNSSPSESSPSQLGPKAKLTLSGTTKHRKGPSKVISYRLRRQGTANRLQYTDNDKLQCSNEIFFGSAIM